MSARGRLLATLVLAASCGCSFSCSRILGLDPGHLGGAGGASQSSATSTGSSGGAGNTTSSSNGSGGAGGAGCAPPDLSYLQSGDIRFVADDLAPGTLAGGWKARTPDGTILLSGPSTPVLTPNAFNGCHQGVEVGYAAAGNRWLHSANLPVALSDVSHTLAAVISIKTFDALNAGPPQTPAFLFLSGTPMDDHNSALGVDVVDPTHAFSWNGGYGLTFYDGSTALHPNTVYVMVKTVDGNTGDVRGYVDSILDATPANVTYVLNDDIGIGGVAFSSQEVQFTNGLDSVIAEAIVMHRALTSAEVKTLSCDLSNAYGGGPLNCL